MTSPKVLLRENDEVKVVDIDACLLDTRIVYLGTQVNSESSNAVIKQLLLLEHRAPGEPITLYINSPGGSVVDGMAIYDTLQRISSPVHAVVAGMAASMGAVILSGCEKGQRSIMKNGEVLLHQPMGGSQGSASDIEISARRLLKMKQTLLRLLAENCDQPYEKLVEDCDRDHWLDADEALAYGIVDHII